MYKNVFYYFWNLDKKNIFKFIHYAELWLQKYKTCPCLSSSAVMASLNEKTGSIIFKFQFCYSARFLQSASAPSENIGLTNHGSRAFMYSPLSINTSPPVIMLSQNNSIMWYYHRTILLWSLKFTAVHSFTARKITGSLVKDRRRRSWRTRLNPIVYTLPSCWTSQGSDPTPFFDSPPPPPS